MSTCELDGRDDGEVAQGTRIAVKRSSWLGVSPLQPESRATMLMCDGNDPDSIRLVNEEYRVRESMKRTTPNIADFDRE
jgi:hypothetical protein